VRTEKVSTEAAQTAGLEDAAADRNVRGPAVGRLVSLDAFRGFTIAGMIFVIMVAGYRNLPQTFPAFGSAPVSTWKHAGEDFEPREWKHWDGDRTFHAAKRV